MKKVVVIWSSPNRDGLTASAKERFIVGLEKTAQVEEIHLNTRSLEHCRACGNGWGSCNKTGSCIIRDDFSDIYKSLAEADGIVWISAVYWSDMTEQFKAFFDRLRRCDATHNHHLADKRCIIIACCQMN
ncbi:MAG: flavodoxin family protein [Lachnospiraceae bacterium]|nr:flavodoxin family protein [Lachnospiraceae bacterium]